MSATIPVTQAPTRSAATDRQSAPPTTSPAAAWPAPQGPAPGARLPDRTLLHDLARLEDHLRTQDPTGAERAHIDQRMRDIVGALAANRAARRDRPPEHGRW